MPFQNSSKNKALGNIKLPNEVFKRGEKALAKELSKSAGIRKEIKAILGNAVTGVLYVPDTNDSVLFISEAGEEPSYLGTLPKIGIPEKLIIPRQPIRVRKTASGSFEYVGIDTDTAQVFNEGDSDAIDQSPVSQSQFDFASLQPFTGMTATVKGFIKADAVIPDTQTADFSASPLDTLSNPIDIPTTANRAIGVLVQVDPTTGVLSYKQSSELASSISLPQAYRNNLLPLRDTGKFRMGYIKLANGITQLDYASVWSCAEFFPASGVTGGGSSTDTAIALWDGTTGTLLKNSSVLIDSNANLTALGSMAFVASTELTIASGAITITQGFHRIDTEANAASDDLDTINGGTTNRLLYIRAEDGARTVVVRHNGGGSGNIRTPNGASISLDETYKFLLLAYDATLSLWNVIGGGGLGGSTGAIDDSILRANGTGGATVQAGSGVTVSDAGLFSGGNWSLNSNYFDFGTPLSVPIAASGINSNAIGVSRNFVLRANSGTVDDFLGFDGALPIGTIILFTARVGDTLTLKHNDAGATNKLFLASAADYVLTENNPIAFTQRSSTVLAEFAWSASGGGVVDLTTDVTGVLPIANGGTNGATATAGFDNLAPTTTKGDLVVHNGTDNVRLPVGSNYTRPRANSADSEGIDWIATSVIANKTYKFGSDQTTTSTTHVDVDATNAAITATLIGNGYALVRFSFRAFKQTAGSGYFRITDGTLNGDETEVTFTAGTPIINEVSWIFPTTAGSTTYKLQFRSSNANSVLLSSTLAVGMQIMEVS